MGIQVYANFWSQLQNQKTKCRWKVEPSCATLRRVKMDETYVKVKGQWMYLYRAVDKAGNTIDFLLSPNRKRRSAHAFLIKAINQNGIPSLINIDKSGANKAGIKVFNQRNWTKIKWRQCKYLNNIVEQDHRFIKWQIGPMLGFKSFESAKPTLAGIELVRMLKKNQMIDSKSSTYKTFCSLAAWFWKWK